MLRGNGRHYTAWPELYRARFPDRVESVRLLAPLLDDYVGGDATCRVLTEVPSAWERLPQK